MVQMVSFLPCRYKFPPVGWFHNSRRNRRFNRNYETTPIKALSSTSSKSSDVAAHRKFDQYGVDSLHERPHIGIPKSAARYARFRLFMPTADSFAIAKISHAVGAEHCWRLRSVGSDVESRPVAGPHRCHVSWLCSLQRRTQRKHALLWRSGMALSGEAWARIAGLAPVFPYHPR
jgi:hypothetical protein